MKEVEKAASRRDIALGQRSVATGGVQCDITIIPHDGNVLGDDSSWEVIEAQYNID